MGFLHLGLVGMQCATLFRMFIVLAVTVMTFTEAHQCNVVVYFGQKTAECQALGLSELPQDMEFDLKVLQFKDNNLTDLSIDFFKGYTAIQELFLEYNTISTVAAQAFRGLSNLQILDLTGNDLSTVPISSFHYLTSLRELILKSNPIKYITANAFAYLPRIEVLNFENCWLKKINPKAFHALSFVTEINLVNNVLKSLEVYMEPSLPPNLRIFRLYHNPWHCDCHLRWLHEWIEINNVNWDFSKNTPACTTPEIMKGLHWKHLMPSQFACPSKILVNSTTSLEVHVGQNVTIECLVTGDPRPAISWLKEGRHITMSSNMHRYRLDTSGHDPIHSTLSIWDVGLEDAGDYKCIAVNSAGRSEVTNKLWIWEGINMSAGAGISQDSILGIAVGSALFLLILLVCAVYGLRKRDKRKHAYRVRDYRKPNKNKKDKSYKENWEISTGTMTELLSEKEKEMGKFENQIRDTRVVNSAKGNREEYKVELFEHSSDGTKNPHVQLDLSHTAPDEYKHATKPLCEDDTLKPKFNNMREVTPDLLKNDNSSPKPHHTEGANQITIKEESPNIKGEYMTNSSIYRQKDLLSDKDYGKDSSKEGKKNGNKGFTNQRGCSQGSQRPDLNPDHLDQLSEVPHYSTSSVGRIPHHQSEPLSDCVTFANSSPSNRLPHTIRWGPTQTSPQSSQAIKQGSRSATTPNPSPKVPNRQFVGRKDNHALVVPSTPLPRANNPPIAAKSPSGPGALVNPRDGLPPAPRKPPRTYSSRYENPYGKVSWQGRRQDSQGSCQSGQDGKGDSIVHNKQHNDDLGTGV